jgi:putative membrane protein
MGFARTLFGLTPAASPLERLVAFVIEWALLAAAVWVAAALLDGVSYVGWESLALVALILGLLNALLKPVLTLLTFPLAILTLGLFTLVINIVLFWLTDVIAGEIDRIQFTVANFLWDVVLAALIVTVVRWALGMLVRQRPRL